MHFLIHLKLRLDQRGSHSVMYVGPLRVAESALLDLDRLQILAGRLHGRFGFSKLVSIYRKSMYQEHLFLKGSKSTD